MLSGGCFSGWGRPYWTHCHTRRFGTLRDVHFAPPICHQMIVQELEKWQHKNNLDKACRCVPIGVPAETGRHACVHVSGFFALLIAPPPPALAWETQSICESLGNHWSLSTGTCSTGTGGCSDPPDPEKPDRPQHTLLHTPPSPVCKHGQSQEQRLLDGDPVLRQGHVCAADKPAGFGVWAHDSDDGRSSNRNGRNRVAVSSRMLSRTETTVHKYNRAPVR